MSHDHLIVSLRVNIAALRNRQEQLLSELVSVQLALQALKTELEMCEREWAALPQGCDPLATRPPIKTAGAREFIEQAKV